MASIKKGVAALIGSAVERVDHSVAPKLVERHITDMTIEWVLRSAKATDFEYPEIYVNFLYESIRAREVRVQLVKPASGATPADVRFRTMLDELSARLPAAPLSILHEAGAHADTVVRRTDPIDYSTWSADMGLHFLVSSSLGRKGRLLHAVVRHTRPTSYLELGTAYGMSALIAARTMAMFTNDWSLTTVEALEQQRMVSAPMLKDRFGERVDCRLGYSKQCLAELRGPSPQFDFMFHDAAHSYDDYVSDFTLAEPMLKAGAVCLIDDIRWEDPRFPTTGGSCYDGWRAIAQHARVRAAAELDDAVGIVLLD